VGSTQATDLIRRMGDRQRTVLTPVMATLLGTDYECAAMHMFCFQCQETSEGRGCTFGGHCGKSEEAANFQDLLIYGLKGLGLLSERLIAEGEVIGESTGALVFEALFTTVTNTNFDPDRIVEVVDRVLEAKRDLLARLVRLGKAEGLNDIASWDAPRDKYNSKAYGVGVLQTEDPDVRGLRETITYGLKGIASYAHHAGVLGRYSNETTEFVLTTLASLTKETNFDRLFDLALATGRQNLSTMAALDAAHTESFGTQTPRHIPIGVKRAPGILVTGHDLVELRQLLEQTRGTGVDVYTNGEMIAAHYYPALYAFEHLAGNYGNAWWKQDDEFAKFNGPIVVTSNCIIPVTDAYKDRIFTSSVAGYPGVPHLTRRLPSGELDFAAVIELAKQCSPPEAIDEGTMPGGYSHAPLWGMLDAVLDLIKSKAVSRVVVMAGCDGRDKRREYYREVAEKLPKDTLILTAGCAKYVFCKLDLGTIAGVPRVLDAGQCNDCYSLIHFAVQLASHLNVDINDLPISYQVCWFDQKAVAVYLTLLSLGVKQVWLGPTLPAYFSNQLVKRLKRDFNLRTIGNPEADLALMAAGA